MRENEKWQDFTNIKWNSKISFKFVDKAIEHDNHE